MKQIIFFFGFIVLTSLHSVSQEAYKYESETFNITFKSLVPLVNYETEDPKTVLGFENELYALDLEIVDISDYRGFDLNTEADKASFNLAKRLGFEEIETGNFLTLIPASFYVIVTEEGYFTDGDTTVFISAIADLSMNRVIELTVYCYDGADKSVGLGMIQSFDFLIQKE